MIHSNHLPFHEKEPIDPAPEGLGSQAQLMDVRGLATYLHLDRQTIYNWLHQHKLSGIKVGGVWRFDRRSVEAWLQAQTVGSADVGHRPHRSRHGTVPPVE